MTQTHKKSRRPTLRTIEQQLVADLRAIVKACADDNTQLNKQMGDYIANLNTVHPDWTPVMEQHRKRRLDRILDPLSRVRRHISQRK